MADDGAGVRAMAATSPGDQGGGPGRAGRMARLGRELQAEVRRRRAEGSFPPSLEGALDRAFQAVVPERASAGFPEALRRVEEASYVDLEVPTASRVPGGSRAKALLRSLMAWYLNYLADQVNRFAATTLRALRLLEARVADLEEEAGAGRPLLPPAPGGVGTDPSSGWADLVRARLAGAAGPVLHAECGTAA
ncbi:MAG TPA: hypothetical protein VE152_02610, partial [Acidimicrobiales bacterium]|nr:hypothetical protein [Acidimicrobiales bacterium]